jgi:hypothetical protein
MTNRFERARDLRQLRFMLSAIRSYEASAATLDRLIADLTDLEIMLSGVDAKWRERLNAARASLAKNPKKAVRSLTRLLETEIALREREQPDA